MLLLDTSAVSSLEEHALTDIRAVCVEVNQ